MTVELPARTQLAVLPTPLEHAARLSARWGGPQIWIKRDDLTGFELSGNKVRKLEFHFAAASEVGADTVITCGAVQSNHSRATTMAAARLGFRCILYLRKPVGVDAPPLSGNYLLDRLGGARVRFIEPNDWELRGELMAAEAVNQAANGHRSWVIPEGASDALGMWGYVLAMRELVDQAMRIPGRPATVWHAASSGGTTAGLGWAAHRFDSDLTIAACSIGDPAQDLADKVADIWQQAATATGTDLPTVAIDYIDRHVGAGYGLVSDNDLRIQAEATSLTGLVFDPTYTGKALAGLRRDIAAGLFTEEDNLIFWHTGGGFAVFSHDFSRIGVAGALDELDA